jgi:hypothetical protein
MNKHFPLTFDHRPEKSNVASTSEFFRQRLSKREEKGILAQYTHRFRLKAIGS